jgi:hypothetical protein
MTNFRAVIALAIAGFCESVSAADTVKPVDVLTMGSGT